MQKLQERKLQNIETLWKFNATKLKQFTTDYAFLSEDYLAKKYALNCPATEAEGCNQIFDIFSQT